MSVDIDEGGFVYSCYGNDRLLYVGRSVDAVRRLEEHRRTAPWWPQVTGISVRSFDRYVDAVTAEAETIASGKPQHNVNCQQRPTPAMSPAKRARLDRRSGLLCRYASTDETLADIGADLGITRQAVAALLASDPVKYASAKRVRAARRRTIAAAEAT